MRKLIYFVHQTVNGFIANAHDQLWGHFPWGEIEMAYNNAIFRAADTWVLGHNMYDVIVPWWTAVAEGTPPEDAGVITKTDVEFAILLYDMTKVVISTTVQPTGKTEVIRGDLTAALTALKDRPGRNILLSCGPNLLATLAHQSGLIDEYFIIVHPVALSNGKPLFGALKEELPLKLIETKSFEAGCVVLHYRSMS